MTFMLLHRYQGLQSFRTSPWCQNENLPIEYGRIFRFDNIKLLKKSVRKQEVSDAVQVSIWLHHLYGQKLWSYVFMHGKMGL